MKSVVFMRKVHIILDHIIPRIKYFFYTKKYILCLCSCLFYCFYRSSKNACCNSKFVAGRKLVWQGGIRKYRHVSSYWRLRSVVDVRKDTDNNEENSGTEIEIDDANVHIISIHRFFKVVGVNDIVRNISLLRRYTHLFSTCGEKTKMRRNC